MVVVLACLFVVLGSVLPFLGCAEHPLSLSGLVFVISLCVCVVMGLCVSSYYAYVLFLVYAGALLVVFTFSTALTSNPKFEVGGLWYGLGVGVLLVVFFWFVWEYLFFFKWHSRLEVSVPGSPLHDGVHIVGSVGGLHGIVVVGFVMFVVIVSCAKLCARQSGALRGGVN